MKYLKYGHGKWQKLNNFIFDGNGLSAFDSKGKYIGTWNGNRILKLPEESIKSIKK